VPLPKFNLKESSGLFLFRFDLRADFSLQKRIFCFARIPSSVTNGAYKRADLLHHNMWTSLFMVYAGGTHSLGLVIHHDPVWTFYGHSHFARGPFSPLSFHKRTFSASWADRVLAHADLCPPRARTFFVCVDH